MRGDQIIQTQLLMAQAFGSLADVISNSSGYAFTPVTFDTLVEPAAGSVACISDSAVTTGAISAGGGSNTVMAFYNGTAWKVFAA